MKLVDFQQLRKLVLELIHRLPANDHLKGHVKVYNEHAEQENNIIIHVIIIKVISCDDHIP